MEFPIKTRRFTFRNKKSRLRSFINVKKIANIKCQEKIKLSHQEESKEKSWNILNPMTITSKERKVYVANFRRITGHDLLYKHLASIGIKPTPQCPQCNESEQTAEHLLSCRKLESFNRNIDEKTEVERFSEIYWHVREIQ